MPVESHTVESHTIAVLVDNEAGVLARVIGLFSGRGYNLESLTVAEVDSAEGQSRTPIVTSGPPQGDGHRSTGATGAGRARPRAAGPCPLERGLGDHRHYSDSSRKRLTTYWLNRFIPKVMVNSNRATAKMVLNSMDPAGASPWLT